MPRSPRITLQSIVVIVVSWAASSGALAASDWPQFRGPDFGATGTADWPAEATLEVAWRAPLGAGYSGVVVAEGRAYTGFADETADWLAAFDTAGGEERWRVRLGDPFPALAGGYGGPNATPALGEGLVFAVGGHGELVAVRPDGQEVWRRDLTEWAAKPDFGFASSPFIVRDRAEAILVVQAPGREGKILFGLEPATGKELWSTGDDTSAFQTPVWTRLAGQEQIVVSGNPKLMGVTSRGEILWTFDLQGTGVPSPKGRQVNVPLAFGDDRIAVRPSAERVTAVEIRRDAACEPSAGDAETACPFYAVEVWNSSEVARTYVPSIYSHGVVYGRKGPLLVAIDPGDGELLWRSRTPGDGFFSSTDDHLLVMTKRGSLHLGSAGAQGFTQQAWLQVFNDASWTEPTIAEGSIFVRSMTELARVEVRPLHQAKDTPPDGDAEWIDVSRFGAALPDTTRRRPGSRR